MPWVCIASEVNLGSTQSTAQQHWPSRSMKHMRGLSWPASLEIRFSSNNGYATEIKISKICILEKRGPEARTASSASSEHDALGNVGRFDRSDPAVAVLTLSLN